MTAHFIKHYGTPAAANTAAAHYHWLTGLAAVGLPNLVHHHGDTLEFTHIPGRTGALADLPVLAAALGRLHRTARHGGLDHAQANSRLRTRTGLILAPFADPRRRRLHALRDRAEAPLSHPTIDQWLDAAAQRPVALYKDANPRNFLLTNSSQVIVVDFDTLTLAPAGYDLAKLLVTTAMTTGDLPIASAETALAVYNDELGETCLPEELAVWAEMHDLLTRPYLGHGNYHHPWPEVRPWPLPAKGTTDAHHDRTRLSPPR